MQFNYELKSLILILNFNQAFKVFCYDFIQISSLRNCRFSVNKLIKFSPLLPFTCS